MYDTTIYKSFAYKLVLSTLKYMYKYIYHVFKAMSFEIPLNFTSKIKKKNHLNL